VNTNTGAVTVIEGPQGGRTCRAQLVKYDMSVLHISQTHAPRGAASALFSPCSLGRPGPTAIAYRLRALGLATFSFESVGIEMRLGERQKLVPISLVMGLMSPNQLRPILTLFVLHTTSHLCSQRPLFTQGAGAQLTRFPSVPME